ncbi:MAG: helix-turn-helix domain-containing protein [Promethearchaeota archaeon]
MAEIQKINIFQINNMINMYDTQISIFSFQNKPFRVDDVVKHTGLAKGSVRNLLSELQHNGLITSRTAEKSKRERVYQISWAAIVNLIKEAHPKVPQILQQLNLEAYTGQFVVLQDFKVIGADLSLYALTEKFWEQLENPNVVLTSVGSPRSALTLEI